MSDEHRAFAFEAREKPTPQIKLVGTAAALADVRDTIHKAIREGSAVLAMEAGGGEFIIRRDDDPHGGP